MIASTIEENEPELLTIIEEVSAVKDAESGKFFIFNKNLIKQYIDHSLNIM